MDHGDREPVFVRSRWGTNRYVYNHRNPVGAALIVVTLVLAVILLALMERHAGPSAKPEPGPSSPSTAPLDERPWPSPTNGTGSPPTPGAAPK